jgi:hypothetical protein
MVDATIADRDEVMKLDDMGAAESTTLRINMVRIGTSSKAGEMDSSTQSCIGLLAHPTALFDASYQLLGLLFSEKLPATARAHAGQIRFVRCRITMWAGRRWGDVDEIVEIEGVCPRSSRRCMVGFMLR